MNLKEIIEELREKRPVFHSEDDVKFSLAYLIKKHNEALEIRLEKPFDLELPMRWKEFKQKGYHHKGFKKVKAPIDIVVRKEGKEIPIEIKYKTAGLKSGEMLQLDINGEIYNLSDHGAADVGRFSFRKDLFRLEQFLEKNDQEVGYFLVITNEPKYWKKPKDNAIDEFFDFSGKTIIPREDKSWSYKKLKHPNTYDEIDDQVYRKKGKGKFHWTCSGDHLARLNLNSTYKAEWVDYSDMNETKGQFKFLLIEVPRK